MWRHIHVRCVSAKKFYQSHYTCMTPFYRFISIPMSSITCPEYAYTLPKSTHVVSINTTVSHYVPFPCKMFCQISCHVPNTQPRSHVSTPYLPPKWRPLSDAGILSPQACAHPELFLHQSIVGLYLVNVRRNPSAVFLTLRITRTAIGCFVHGKVILISVWLSVCDHVEQMVWKFCWENPLMRDCLFICWALCHGKGPGDRICRWRYPYSQPSP